MSTERYESGELGTHAGQEVSALLGDSAEALTSDGQASDCDGLGANLSIETV